MKNENYGLIYTRSNGEKGFCFINSCDSVGAFASYDDEGLNQIDSYENVLATKHKLETFYPNTDYRIVRFTMEEVE